jgi:HTH-type transcriptional regulator / antitoxin HigA
MANVPTKYLALIKSFPLRPIHNEQELHRAENVLRHLVDARHLSEPEEDYLLLLGNLIAEYEAEAHPVEPLPPHEMLAGLMEAKGVNQVQLHEETGIAVSTISELLAKKRSFNTSHIEKFCAYFGVGPGAFIQVPAPAVR